MPQLGFVQFNTTAALVANEESNAAIHRVKILLQEASAYYALWYALPFINLQITNFGIKTTNTTSSDNADWKDLRDLKRYCVTTADEAVDAALEIMEANPGEFPGWTASDAFTVFNKQLVRHTKEFQAGFDICNSRKTFLSVQSAMKEVEEQYLLSLIGKTTLDLLKDVSVNETVLRTQELCRLAIVALTVAKVATTGKFVFTATSFQLKSEELPWEKTKLDLTP
jgi:hypothetical protein